MGTIMAHAATMDAEAAPDAPKRGPGKRKLILIGAPIAVLVVSAGLWFSGVLPRLLGHLHEAGAEAHGETAPPVFFELPEMVVNLNGNVRRPSYLKLQAKLELARKEDSAIVQAALPRLLDLFQTYLREMRPEELRGSAGTYRLREELAARGNLAVAPARIKDVLFTEMLIQ
jgi:flagellar protein FliL